MFKVRNCGGWIGRSPLLIPALLVAGTILVLCSAFGLASRLERTRAESRATVRAVDTKTDVILPEGWSQTLVRFTYEGCQFVGVQHGYSITSVWHSPKCPCRR